MIDFLRAVNFFSHPRHTNGNLHMALGDRRSVRITAGSVLGCARGRHPRVGLAVRCGDLALSPKNMPFCTFFTCSQNSSSLRNKRPGFSGRPHCKGVAIGVARRGPRRSGERALRVPPYTKMASFSLIPKVFRPCLSKPSYYGAPQWALIWSASAKRPAYIAP